jgi:hypothetical protein
MARAILWLDLDGRSTVTATFLTLAFGQLFNAHDQVSAWG